MEDGLYLDDLNDLKVLNNLPCYPCPHKSVCCSWGTDLTFEEAIIIKSIFGSKAVTKENGEYRTSIVDGKCFFLDDNKCSIHNEQYYPYVCKGFPKTDGILGGEYKYQIDICPEITDRDSKQSIME